MLPELLTLFLGEVPDACQSDQLMVVRRTPRLRTIFVCIMDETHPRFLAELEELGIAFADLSHLVP